MHLLRMPSLGETMEWGILTAYLVEEGKAFSIGDNLYEVENEKTTLSVEALTDGVLARWVGPLDEQLAVGALIAVVAEPGEDFSKSDIDGLIESYLPPRSGTEASETFTPGQQSTDTKSKSKIRAMPKARSLAAELGIELSEISGTGKGGAITLQDVENLATPAKDASSTLPFERVRLSTTHRTMAERLSNSWPVTPHFTVSNLVDASQLLSQKSQSAKNFSVNDLLAAATLRAVERVPRINSSFSGDSLLVYEDINLAVAVDTERGLVAPVIHKAHELGFDSLVAEISRLAAAAREQSLLPSELQDATITISNLGMHGVDFGTPVLTSPQSAIVFFGAIKPRPFVTNGTLEVVPSLHVTAAFDHRSIDGALGARFLAALTDEIEKTES